MRTEREIIDEMTDLTRAKAGCDPYHFVDENGEEEPCKRCELLDIELSILQRFLWFVKDHPDSITKTEGD